MITEATPRHLVLATRLITISLASVAAFGYPFLGPALLGSRLSATGAIAAPLLLALAMAVTVALVWETADSTVSVGGQAAKCLALLGAIVAVDACLRLVPSLGGASAIFPLIVLAGAVFGGRFGFLAGSLTLLISAIVTGGIGAWLPLQMLAAGWVGTGAALVARWPRRPVGPPLLALYGAASGILYGVLMSAATWPLAAPGAGIAASLYWQADAPVLVLVRRYVTYYLATSLLHDLTRGLATALLLILFARPLIRLLHRSRERMGWERSTVTIPTDPQ